MRKTSKLLCLAVLLGCSTEKIEFSNDDLARTVNEDNHYLTESISQGLQSNQPNMQLKSLELLSKDDGRKDLFRPQIESLYEKTKDSRVKKQAAQLLNK